MEPLSRDTLITKGVCCGCKCTNCPYFPKHWEGVTDVIDVDNWNVNDEAIRILRKRYKAYAVERKLRGAAYYKTFDEFINALKFLDIIPTSIRIK